MLAGGRGQRLGGQDKGLLPLAGRPLIEHVLARFSPQVDNVLISANRNLAAYTRLGHPILEDGTPAFDGPLAGIARGLADCKAERLAVVPCDCPFLPHDLVARLQAALTCAAADVAVARSAARIEPVFAVLRTSLGPALQTFLAQGGRQTLAWYRQHRVVMVDFPDPASFVNLNTPQDLAHAAEILPPCPREPRVLGVAGYSGSGKTHLLTRLIPPLREAGLRIGVVKHAHHAFEIDHPGKDSYEVRHAGAERVMIASARRWAIVGERQLAEEPTLAAMLEAFDHTGLDLIFVEGFRHERFPKIEIHRRLESADPRPLLCADDETIVALASDYPVTPPRALPILDLDDTVALLAFIGAYLAGPVPASHPLQRIPYT